MTSKKYRYGQTLVELVVAIGVVAMVLMALISAVTASLRYGQVSRNRSVAVKLAQEGMELSRKLRDESGWSTFLTYASVNSGRWCLDLSGQFSQADSNGICPVSAENPFWRLLTFQFSDPTMTVDVSVSWGERNALSTVQLRTNFTEWK